MSLKIDLINSMYAMLRISGITEQPTPQHLEAALFRLEDMMAELEDNYGLCIGYNFEERPDANTDSGVKRSANHTIASNLAVRMIPDFNKMVPQALNMQASQSMSALTGVIAAGKLRQVQPSSRMSVGSGHRYRQRYQRFYTPENLAPNECATNKMEIGEINDYQESFIAYLKGELISDFTVTSSTGLSILSSAISGVNVGIIDYRIQSLRTSISHQHVIISIVTDSGRIETQTINFEIKHEDDLAATQLDENGNNLLGGSLLGTPQLGG